MAYFVGDFSEVLGYEPVTVILDEIDIHEARGYLDHDCPEIVFTWDEVNL